MLSKLKLSYKIGLGYGAILFVVIIVGIFTCINALGVKNQTTILSDEHAPEVRLANNIERYSLLTMYSLRGYTLTFDENYLDEGKARLGELKKYISEGHTLAENAKDLKVLREIIPKAEDRVKHYEDLLSQTIVKVNDIGQFRKNLDDNAAQFTKLCNEYLTHQNEALNTKLSAGDGKDNISESIWKVNIINEIRDLGNQVSIANFKSQALRQLQIAKDAEKNFNLVYEKIDKLLAKSTVQVTKEQLESIKNSAKTYNTELNALVKTWSELQDLNGIRVAAADQVIGIAKEMSTTGIDSTIQKSQDAAKSMNTTLVITIVGLVLTLLLGIFGGYLIVRSISKPMVLAVDSLNESAEQVSAASIQLSQASQRLAEANAEQASSIEETSATLEESSSMIQQNSENTRQAATISAQAKKFADKGNEQMAEMMESMTEIKKSSDQIAKIIKVIDEIAFQTNILALNAAVEAARAGEAGMGFAVVADEVRNLAQRSAQAAKDTASMIENNIVLSDKGVRVAEKVGDALNEITLQSKKVNELMDEIAAASLEQAQGISQINKAMQQMEKVTQQNAATAEESAASSEQLNAQSESVKDTVRQLAVLVNGNTQGTAFLKRDLMKADSLMVKKNNGHKAVYGKTTARQSIRKQPDIKTRIINPEDVIPLEDDLDDF